jgi:hypothetical protein
LKNGRERKETTLRGLMDIGDLSLTTEEERELPESDWRGTDHPDAVKPEEPYEER